MSSVAELAYFLIFLQLFTLFICYLIKNTLIIFYPNYKAPQALNYFLIPLTSFHNYTNFSCLTINTTYNFSFCVNDSYGYDIVLVGYSPSTVPATVYLRNYTNIYVFNSTVNISALCKTLYNLTNKIKFCMNGTKYIFVVNFSKITPTDEYFLKKLFITIYKRTYTVPSIALANYDSKDFNNIMTIGMRDLNVFYCYRLVDNFTTKKPDLQITIHAIGPSTSVYTCFACIKGTIPYFKKRIDKVYNSSFDVAMYSYFINLSSDFENIVKQYCTASCSGVVLNFTSKINYISEGPCTGTNLLFYRMYKSTGEPSINITNTSYVATGVNLTYVGTTPVLFYNGSSVISTTIYVMNVSVNLSIWYLGVRV